MAEVVLIRIVQTCAGAPSQWDGWDADGNYYYMRYRFGIGTVESQPGPYETHGDEWVLHPKADALRYFNDREEWDPLGESYIPLDEFLRKANVRYAQ